MRDKTAEVRRRALGEKLKAMFRTVERRPIPAGLREVVDQLEATVEPPRKRPAKKA